MKDIKVRVKFLVEKAWKNENGLNETKEHGDGIYLDI